MPAVSATSVPSAAVKKTDPAGADATPPYGLYIHVPFCRSRCRYCDFCTRPGAPSAMVDAYIDAALAEMASRLPAWPSSTVYIGGGTPSLLSPDQLARLVEPIDLSRCTEFTIEANPDDVTPAWVASVRSLGIGRVSMGIQTLVASELAAIGRRHTPARALEAVDALVAGGITDVSLDLIYGLPGQTLASWTDTLGRVIGLHQAHLSCYTLTYEPGTALTAMAARGLIAQASPELVSDMYLALIEAARSAGYSHYEISNFSLPGHRSRHNASYWTCSTPYIGIGPGAHSLSLDLTRCYHLPDPVLYCKSGHTATLTPDPETPLDRLNDYIITRLRTSDGLLLSSFARRFGSEAARRLLSDARLSIAAGNLHLATDPSGAPTVLTVPEARWLVTDTVLSDLLRLD